ncbi:PREDICTED: uncharacterized protein LOC104813805 isoform X2 [Tarenaya hassleriana]|nr:PREDICTED: uncharacterized protein LOC104813805 isoform X2 [Tarenaya hassleriana]XP_010539879.1 PREDICTED: uncharacterized protein LOC104813805 isoform X2 [Tarenaya hassleriana]XP_019059312.1 PREDICTED: uncharacterized protein LOC104813805 isoform X2 [Tarenaya hassleriana]
MGDFSIQISSRLISQLLEGNSQQKRKQKKAKPKVSPKPKSESKKTLHDSEAKLPVQPPFFLPTLQQPPQTAAYAELEAIRSVLKESEKVLEKLEKQEKNMGHEVTERAMDLRDKEFKIPSPKPMPCSLENDVWMKCYKENVDDPLKCGGFARSFADCARRVRQQASSVHN